MQHKIDLQNANNTSMYIIISTAGMVSLQRIFFFMLAYAACSSNLSTTSSQEEKGITVNHFSKSLCFAESTPRALDYATTKCD